MENLLIKRARLTPDKIGLSFYEEQWTFQELLEVAHGVLNQLVTRVGQLPQRVAILGKNRPNLYFAFLGSMLGNCEIVVLNNRLTKEEIAEQLLISTPACLLYDPELGNSVPAQWLDQSISLDWLVMANQGKASFIEAVAEVSLEDTHTIMFTSGTTGSPKGVRQTFKNHLASAAGSRANLGVAETDKWLLVVPLFHISGYSMLMKGLIYGNQVVLVDKFSPSGVVEQMHQQQVTHLSLVPTMLLRLIETPGFIEHAQGMSAILLGGAAVNPKLLEKCLQSQLPIIQSFGMTETASQVVALNHQDSRKKVGSSGKPLKGVSLKIAASQGEDGVGEILIKADNITSGYLNSPLGLTPDGYFKTGDLGYLDEEGFLFVVGRQKELIISGGENIYPFEIEKRLLEHPGIQEVAVTSEPDGVWGEKVVAYYCGESKVIANELTRVLGGLASYKHPKTYYQIATMPKNSLGKLLKKQLPGQAKLATYYFKTNN